MFLTPPFCNTGTLSQNQLTEAELCVKDCHECRNEAELTTEIATAVAAVDEAVACFVDLIDDSRSNSSSTGTSSSASERDGPLSTNKLETNELVQRIKQLRKDIFQLKAKATAVTAP
jgi:hypothetical protein